MCCFTLTIFCARFSFSLNPLRVNETRKSGHFDALPLKANAIPLPTYNLAKKPQDPNDSTGQIFSFPPNWTELSKIRYISRKVSGRVLQNLYCIHWHLRWRSVRVCTVDMDETPAEEMKPSTPVETEVHGTMDNKEDVQPPYHHVDELTTRTQVDRAAADEARRMENVDGPSDEASSPSSLSKAEHRQQPRSTTKCRVIPIVVSGQSTARLGQLCYETADNSDPRRWRHRWCHAWRRTRHYRPNVDECRVFQDILAAENVNAVLFPILLWAKIWRTITPEVQYLHEISIDDFRSTVILL